MSDMELIVFNRHLTAEEVLTVCTYVVDLDYIYEGFEYKDNNTIVYFEQSID